jgi:Thiamine monophosphate synthase
MILVITPEQKFPNETEIINQMFQEGLDLLHIRKPGISKSELTAFISNIDQSFYPQLVLHTHYELGKEHNISRFHYREADREEKKYKPVVEEHTISTSVHDIRVYNRLEKEWEYAFISPFFPSISKKGYGENTTVMEDINSRNNEYVKLIALGGIDAENIQKVFDAGADGAALLGGIWEREEPLEAFMKCRKKVFL